MPKRDDILDRTMLTLSDAHDDVTVRDPCNGTLITGSLASGKATTSAKQFAYALLKSANAGRLVLTAKAEDTQNWIAYAKACGREEGLIITAKAEETQKRRKHAKGR